MTLWHMITLFVQIRSINTLRSRWSSTYGSIIKPTAWLVHLQVALALDESLQTEYAGKVVSRIEFSGNPSPGDIELGVIQPAGNDIIYMGRVREHRQCTTLPSISGPE